MDEETFGNPPVAEEVIEQTPEVESQQGQQTTPTEQVSQPEPDWMRAGYKSPEQMYSELRKHQSEADRLKLENQRLRTPAQPQQVVDPAIKREQELQAFIELGPDGYIAKKTQEIIAPILVRAEIIAFAQDGHPEVLEENFRNRMRELAERNPALASDPDGLGMLYDRVKKEFDSVKTANAQTQVNATRQQAEQVKRTDAFVESSTQPKRSAEPLLKPGMSAEESMKALKAMGIGDAPEDPFV